jgi:hypothetical protein
MVAALAVALYLYITTLFEISMLFKFSMLGSWLVFLLAVLVFFGDGMRLWLRNTLIVIAVVLNIYWTAYLFNCFLNDGWIFT